MEPGSGVSASRQVMSWHVGLPFFLVQFFCYSFFSFSFRQWLGTRRQELVQVGKSCHDTLDCACGGQSNEATGFSWTKLIVKTKLIVETKNNLTFACFLERYCLLYIWGQSIWSEEEKEIGSKCGLTSRGAWNKTPPPTSYRPCPTAIAGVWCRCKKKNHWNSTVSIHLGPGECHKSWGAFIIALFPGHCGHPPS